MESLAANEGIVGVLLIPLCDDNEGCGFVSAIDFHNSIVGSFNVVVAIDEALLQSPNLEAPATLVLESLSLAILLIISKVLSCLVITHTKHALLPKLV